MRDFRDAKAMATSLRQALSDRSIAVTHSDSLELVSKAFGLDNWNVLAARIEAAATAPALAPEPARTALDCSFCGKSQHAVMTLIAGPGVFICNECVGLCEGILVDKKLEHDLAEVRGRRPDAPPLDAAAEALAAYADGQLETTRKFSADWLEHIEWALGQTAAALAGERPTPWRPDETGLKRGWTRDPLEGKSRDEIEANRAHLGKLQTQVAEHLRLLDEVLRRRRAQAG